MKLLEVVYRSTLARVVCADFSGGLGVSRRRNGTIGTVSEVGCCYHRIGSEESTTEEQCVFVRRRKLQILTRRRGAWYLSATYDNEDDDDDIIRIQETTASDDIAQSRAIITISLVQLAEECVCDIRNRRDWKITARYWLLIRTQELQKNQLPRLVVANLSHPHKASLYPPRVPAP